MKITDEVPKTYNMLKQADFEIVDVVFEGAMTIKGKHILTEIEDLASENKATGTIRMVYETGDNEARAIEIPVGPTFEEFQKASQEEEYKP
ncbi:MAG: hypothetical protein J4432_01880 [DPANN group archaeon]|nr:hypothetical protein [DPANN group archaeon]